jgi:transcription regulator MmyB-like protein
MCLVRAPARSGARVSRGARRAAAVKHLHHPVVGELSLSFNRLELAADQGLALFTYAAEPGSRSEEALKLLGSWAATIDCTESARSTDPSTGQPR